MRKILYIVKEPFYPVRKERLWALSVVFLLLAILVGGVDPSPAGPA